MKTAAIIPVLLLLAFHAHPQGLPFEENKKWGLVDNGRVIVPAKYDTVFGFDPTGKVCLACFKIRKSSSNKFMKISSIAFACNYLNPRNERLVTRDGLGDTCSVFSLGRQAISQYSTTGELMVVSAKGDKNLVTKDFRQLTFRGYHNIEPSADPQFYICEYMSESETIYKGLVNREEKQVIPSRYSNIKFNTADSLIIACSAGLFNGTDDVYDYSGKHLTGTNRHIDQVNRRFIVQKIIEPREQFFLVERETGKEKVLDAEEVLLAENEVVRVRKKNSWFSYDAETGEIKPIKQP